MERQKAGFSSDTLAVFSTVDASYVEPAIVALTSMRRHHPEHEYFVLADKKRLAPGQAGVIASAGVHLLHVDDDTFGDEGRWTREAYWLFLAPNLFQRLGFEYSFSLDPDVLVLRDLDLSSHLPRDAHFSGVRRYGKGVRYSLRYAREMAEEFGLGLDDLEADYTNTGVILWNNRRFVEEQLLVRLRRCYEFGRRLHSRMFRCADQSLLAMASRVRPCFSWHVLPTVYNYRATPIANSRMTTEGDAERRSIRFDDIRIVHFSGPKPWLPEVIYNARMSPYHPEYDSRRLLQEMWRNHVRHHTPFQNGLSLERQAAFDA